MESKSEDKTEDSKKLQALYLGNGSDTILAKPCSHYWHCGFHTLSAEKPETYCKSSNCRSAEMKASSDLLHTQKRPNGGGDSGCSGTILAGPYRRLPALWLPHKTNRDTSNLL